LPYVFRFFNLKSLVNVPPTTKANDFVFVLSFFVSGVVGQNIREDRKLTFSDKQPQISAPEEIMGAQTFTFATKFHQNGGFSAPMFAFLEDNFPRGKNLRQTKIQGRGNARLRTH